MPAYHNAIAPLHRFVFILASLLVAAVPAAAQEHSSIVVTMDHARILKLDRPVQQVIVGNSDIADVTVADPKTVVLTGKSYGSTNLVILAKNGDAVVDREIVVSSTRANTVRVYRQSGQSIERTVLSCAASCEKRSSNGN
ncbi:pilus assembly protein N-terminal domain-containing protein [Pararhizobium mangrovi]|uniref:Pilus formation protein N-terminal domain-containing protein n=1 Tax=Pararhizobium mangrovi TaxID=2590452 RepID=A0A506UFS3_9HYPH|nr:pilus assembly protein N-terminal domain-containing protein [Pararhizobium mangrovi]TPW32668.1 hypothetical protein FJU11_00095 [Pararhizobium mangrovi]